MKAKNSSSEWLKLAGYGDHPHTRGVQRLTRAAAEAIVKQHNSLYSKLRRYFGGVPVYIGHPDDVQFRGQPGHTDTRAYAWIHQLEARNDGLWALPTWSKTGREIVANAHYKHLSPRWKLLENADGSWTPIELISIGLTNQPNILGPTITPPGSPVGRDGNQAGSEDGEEGNNDGNEDGEIIGNEEMAENTTDEAEEKPAVKSNYHTDGLPLIACAMGLPADATADAVTAAIKQIQENTAAAGERIALINAQLDLALERGQIALQERAAWAKRMEEDEATAANELQSIPRNAVYMHTPFLSDALTPYQASRVSARAEFIRAVEERMGTTGEDFSTAWSNMKQSRRDIFLKLNS